MDIGEDEERKVVEFQPLRTDQPAPVEPAVAPTEPATPVETPVEEPVPA
jgi:hypothetical protein